MTTIRHQDAQDCHLLPHLKKEKKKKKGKYEILKACDGVLVPFSPQPSLKGDTKRRDTSASFMKLFIQQVFHYDSAKMIK